MRLSACCPAPARAPALALTLALGLAAAWPAAGQEGNVPLSPFGFGEHLRDSPMISGARLAGFAVPERHAAAPEAFHAWLPEGLGGSTLCLRVVAADALYEAWAAYRLPPEQAAGPVRLRFDSAFGPVFWQTRAAELGADGVAVLLTEGTCPDAAEDTGAGSADTTTGTGTGRALPVLPASPGADPVAALLVNSFRAEQAFVFVEGLTDATPCQPIAAPVRTAFDMRCDLVLPPGAAPGAALTATVLPVRGGEMGQPIEVPLWPLPRP